MRKNVAERAAAKRGLAERAAALAALGDPVRLEITDLLATSDLSPDAIATTLDITSNLLAHHLKVLELAGLIIRKQSDNDRRRTYCQLNFEALEGLLPAGAGFGAGAEVGTAAGFRAATASAAAPAHAAHKKPPARVLFVCKHNSARSVLAEAIWNSMSDTPAASAGTDPAPAINPLTLPAAKRAGLVLRTKKPRPLELVLSKDDLVISVCDVANEQLPPLTQKRLHWSLPDPAQIRKPAAFDETVNELRARITRLRPEQKGQSTK